MTEQTPQTAQIWDVTHSRKGSFTAKIVSYHADTCILEVVEGVARAIGGRYEVGDQLDAKTDFLTFHKRREDIEQAANKIVRWTAKRSGEALTVDGFDQTGKPVKIARVETITRHDNGSTAKHLDGTEFELA